MFRMTDSKLSLLSKHLYSVYKFFYSPDLQVKN